MTEEFITLDLRPELTQAVSELGYTEPTPIQSAIIPLMLGGADVIGQAQTGTGKTAAFALPILNNLKPGQKHIQALVLCPTRELALQVSQAFSDYGQFFDVRVLAVYGGQPYGPQITRPQQGRGCGRRYSRPHAGSARAQLSQPGPCPDRGAR